MIESDDGISQDEGKWEIIVSEAYVIDDRMCCAKCVVYSTMTVKGHRC